MIYLNVMNVPYEKTPGPDWLENSKKFKTNAKRAKPYHIYRQNKTFARSLLYVTFFFIFSS